MQNTKCKVKNDKCEVRNADWTGTIQVYPRLHLSPALIYNEGNFFSLKTARISVFTFKKQGEKMRPIR